MSITIDWPTRVISVPQADLTLVSGTLYELDLETFRLALRALEATDDGMFFPATHDHNPPVSVGGVSLAQVVILINGYTVTFEDDQYAVRLVGANSNVGDFVNVNQVSVRTNNSAGLIVVTQGSGVTSQDKTDIIAGVWSKLLEGTETAADILRILRSEAAGDAMVPEGDGDYEFLAADGVTPRIQGTIAGSTRNVTLVDGSE